MFETNASDLEITDSLPLSPGYQTPRTRETNDAGSSYFPKDNMVILGEAADIADLSLTMVEFIVNSFLEVKGVEDYRLSPKKVRSAIDKARAINIEQQKGMKVKMFGFDGKRENTAIMVRDEERVYYETVRVDNISIINLPKIDI